MTKLGDGSLGRSLKRVIDADKRRSFEDHPFTHV
jgi:hypothetical protein